MNHRFCPSAGYCRAMAVLAVLGLAASPVAARDIEILLKPTGATPPSSVAFGQGADLPDMAFDGARKAYHRSAAIEHVEPQVYEIAIMYGEVMHNLPLELHSSSRPVNLRVKFDGPQYCREMLVREAERPAQQGNIAQALERYLLAVHLSEITGEAGKCRGSQPQRLRRARIERGIQLATFRGSPFLPPESDPREWASILGDDRANIYRRQVRQASAIALEEDRRAAIRSRDFASAARVNSYMIVRRGSDDESAATLDEVGLTEGRLLADQDYLENRAEALGQSFVAADVKIEAAEQAVGSDPGE